MEEERGSQQRLGGKQRERCLKCTWMAENNMLDYGSLYYFSSLQKFHVYRYFREIHILSKVVYLTESLTCIFHSIHTHMKNSGLKILKNA